MTRPLEGILVVSVEQAVAAPLCSCRLADAGARVIKVERPEGDFARYYDRAAKGESAYFVWLNRGKQSVIVDLKSEADRALLHRLIARADVFLQNLAPGAAARAGFDPAELRQRHRRLVCCSITGYGESGPYRDMKAYDFLIQAETGLASLTGPPEAPSRVGVSVSDVAAGLNAHAAILQALYAREKSGDGALIHISMFDATGEWMTVPYMNLVYQGKAPQRMGLMHPSIAPYGAYQCGDGKAIVIGIQNEREWVRFCAEVMADAALATDPRFCDMPTRVANRARARGDPRRRLRPAAAGRAGPQAQGGGDRVRQSQQRGGFRRASSAAPGRDPDRLGNVTMPLPPALPSGSALGAVPTLGEHNEAIRREFA